MSMATTPGIPVMQKEDKGRRISEGCWQPASFTELAWREKGRKWERRTPHSLLLAFYIHIPVLRCAHTCIHHSHTCAHMHVDAGLYTHTQRQRNTERLRQTKRDPESQLNRHQLKMTAIKACNEVNLMNSGYLLGHEWSKFMPLNEGRQE